MSKGLEALGELKCFHIGNPDDCLILWDVKEKEISLIERELIALEIIRKKDVTMYWLRNSKSADEYNNFILTEKRQYQKLTPQEYDLLKEVLL